MGKSDVEMVDDEKHTNDSRHNVQESENKLLDAKVENKGEKSPPAAAVARDACNCENGGEDPKNFRHETEDKSTVMSVMEEQINPESEAIESTNAEGSSGGQINTKSENEELSSTKTNAGEQSAARSVVEEHTDAKYEVVEQPNSTNGGVEEVKSTENGINCVNPNEDTMQEKHSEGVTEMKPIEIGREHTDPVEHAAEEEKNMENAVTENNSSENRQFPTEFCGKEARQRESAALGEVLQGDHEETEVNEDEVVKDEPKERGNETVIASSIIDGNAKMVEAAVKHKGDDVSLPNQQEAATPNSLVIYSPAKAGSHSGETVKTVFAQATLTLMADGDDGTPEDQAAFMKELESFYRERAMEFKPPKFYGQPLNCVKLWRAVIRLGGYDRVCVF